MRSRRGDVDSEERCPFEKSETKKPDKSSRNRSLFELLEMWEPLDDEEVLPEIWDYPPEPVDCFDDVPDE